MQSQIQEYLNSTSPLSKLNSASTVPLRDIHNSVDMKLSLLHDRPKHYDTQKPLLRKSHKNSSAANLGKLSSHEEYVEIKASSIVYNIPEFSPPETNFEISNQLRQKINEIKEDIVTKLPTIKSSQFSSNKFESAFSRRTVLKDLQSWLKQKLKNPPLTHEDSIEYKNMIMGVGMKELIRLIGTRCAEEASFVSEIWELTWSICREIILYLSKRAHKCEKILEEETTFFRTNCDSKMKQNDTLIVQMREELKIMREKQEKYIEELTKLKKKNKQLKLIKINLEDMNEELKQQFETAFKQNMMMLLKNNDENQRMWAKKKYAALMNDSRKNNKMFKQFLDRLLSETSSIFNYEDITDMELSIDINQFKIEENRRKFQIEQQLHERFKTSNQHTQTNQICWQNFSVQTVQAEYSEVGMITETETADFATNTDSVGEMTQSKTKKKEKMVRKSHLVINQRKKQPKTSKNQQKVTQVLRQSINQQNSEQQKPKADKKQVSIHQNCPPVSPSSNRLITEQSKQTDLSSQTTVKKQQFSSSKAQRMSITDQSQTSNRMTQNQVRESTLSHSLSQNMKKQPAKQPKARLSITDPKYQQQLDLMKQLLDTKNTAIDNLTKHIKILKEKIVELSNPTEPLIDIRECRENLQQENQAQLQNWIELLREKKYQEVVNELIGYTRNYTEPNEDVDAEEQANEREKKVQQKRFNSLASDCDLEGDEEQPVTQNSGEVRKPAQRKSKRSSKQLNAFALNPFSYKKIREQKQKSIDLGDLTFVQLCNKYFLEKYQTASQSNQKQTGINESNKRVLRQQYREIYKAVNDNSQPQKSQKQMRATIDKGLNFLLKELCREIITAQKQGWEKLIEVKANYNPLFIQLTNRFNMNYGVRKIGSKHVKDLALCLKGVRKYTEKYSIISYFMINSNSLGSNSVILQYQDSQLLFFYILLITLVDATTHDENLEDEDLEIIIQYAKKYLSRDSKFILQLQAVPSSPELENCNSFMKVFKRIIRKYKQLYCEKESEMGFIFQALKVQIRDNKQAIRWADFIRFISVFNISLQRNYNKDLQPIEVADWHALVSRTMMQVLLQDKNSEGLISRQSFIKFLVKCPEFNLASLRTNIAVMSISKEQLHSLAQSNLHNLCQEDQLLWRVCEHLLADELGEDGALDFWVSYIRKSILEKEVEKLVGTLSLGVLDGRTRAVTLQGANK